MSYNEAQDLDEHKGDIDRLFAGLTTAKMALRSDVLVLDVGGGAGMHSAMLTPYAKLVICTDFFDQNTRFNGEFVRLLREKMQRNGREFVINRFEMCRKSKPSVVGQRPISIPGPRSRAKSTLRSKLLRNHRMRAVPLQIQH